MSVSSHTQLITQMQMHPFREKQVLYPLNAPHSLNAMPWKQHGTPGEVTQPYMTLTRR